MNLGNFVSALARQWRLALLALVLAIGAGIGTGVLVGPRYTATQTSVVIPPAAVIAAEQQTRAYAPDNPLLYLGGLTDARDVLVRSLSSDAVDQRAKTQLPGVTLKVTADATSGSPIILFEATAKTQDEAQRGIAFLESELTAAVTRVQDGLGIADPNRVKTLVVTQPAEPTVDRKAQLQAGVLAGGGILVLLLLALGILDGWMTARASGGRTR